MATRGWLSLLACCEGDEIVVLVDFEGVEMPFLSARMESVMVIRGLMTFSAGFMLETLTLICKLIGDSPCAIDVPITVMCPIFRAGFDSLPYMCREAVGIATAFFINSS